MDAPIFFQPRVGLTEVADNLKDLTDDSINLELAKDEIINNPIYKELIISNDGTVTAMQIVLRGNDEYDQLISMRYSIIDRLSSKEVLTVKEKSELQNELNSINKRISLLNNQESEFNKNLISEIRGTLDKYKNDATIYLGGPSMIATDMMDYIESDLFIFGSAVAIMMYFLSLYFVPISQKKLRSIMFEVRENLTGQLIKEVRFFHPSDGVSIYIRESNKNVEENTGGTKRHRKKNRKTKRKRNKHVSFQK